MAMPGVRSRFRSWPITEVRNLEPMLKDMGLKVPACKIDGTSGGDGKCLSDALVSVGPAGRGGTGSFISRDGLIITNHHVAYDAVRKASTPERDYLADGFVARSRGEELPGADYEVWITRSCDDVSDAVLEAVKSEADPLARANAVRDRLQEISKAKESELASSGGKRCDVKEMWPDKAYVLFTYERLRDVRIVYVPPKCLGNFGGDADNFEWPRHTADFTVLRAYVGPDGAPADHSPGNVPYRPQSYFRANPAGISPGDFVFLLGFPGSTMRYAPSCRLAHNERVVVPSQLADFNRKLRLIREHSTDRAAELKLDASRKSLANEQKRCAGKRVMMLKLQLLAERRAEEERLVAAAPDVGPVLERLAEIYGELERDHERDDALELLRGAYHGSALLQVGHALHEAGVEVAKADGEREAAYRDRNLPFLVKRLSQRLKDLHPPHEVALVEYAVEAARKTGFGAAADIIAASSSAATAAVSESPLLGMSSDDLEALLRGARGHPDDVFVKASAAVYPDYVAARDKLKALLSERDRLLARHLEALKVHSEEAFYPDANSALRLSAGHIEGYVAADAVQHRPITTLAGLVDKHVERGLLGTGGGEFDCPPRLVEVCRARPEVLETPVNCCYTTDTVGGNSGSPVLDASGRFVAINFDRQRLGLMNEFKWSIEYSRSIGVDVRYILWLIGSYDGAGHIVDEMTLET